MDTGAKAGRAGAQRARNPAPGSEPQGARGYIPCGPLSIDSTTMRALIVAGLCRMGLSLLCGCSDAADTIGCNQASLAALDESAKTWSSLAASRGKTYWYVEENCAPNMPLGNVTVVEVRDGTATTVRREQIDPAQCQASINRYADHVPATFEQIEASCRSLLQRECDAVFESDERGVLRSCSWVGSDDCDDNCGEGIHIRAWDFGSAPAPMQ